MFPPKFPERLTAIWTPCGLDADSAFTLSDIATEEFQDAKVRANNAFFFVSRHLIRHNT